MQKTYPYTEATQIKAHELLLAIFQDSDEVSK